MDSNCYITILSRNEHKSKQIFGTIVRKNVDTKTNVRYYNITSKTFVRKTCSINILFIYGGVAMNDQYTKAELRTLKVKRDILRRKRQIRMRLTIAAILSFVIILGTAFSLTAFRSNATAKAEPGKSKLYTSVMIEYGSTLSETAQDYIDFEHYESLDDYISEVMFINHLSNADDILAGDHLIMPYYA